ncbi:MAG: SseB family protein [Paracoccus sp. (in: a-proteobacteria)]|nr:SseB family protein [Paracoccus sp. (in: a-proteobacteria)]
MTPLDVLCPQPFHELPDAARARVLNRLADTELFVALASDPEAERIVPRLFELPGGRMAIAADTEDRLAGFFGQAVGFAALPGRVLAGLLAPEGIALLVNPAAPSEMMLDPATLGWLAQALCATPEATDAAPARLSAPRPAIVAALAEPLALRLSDMAGLIESAALVRAEWADGTEAHLIVISGADPGRRGVIAKAVAELIAFLPPLPGPCDVAFDLVPPPGAPVLRPAPASGDAPAAPPRAPRAPGRDPDKPPILRF